MSLTINIATRGRPERLLDTVTRIVPMLVRADTKIVISIDEDDEATLAIRKELPDDKRIIPYTKSREDALGTKWNRALDFPAEVYLPSPDHVVYITHGFDALILEAARLFPDGIGVVYPHMVNFSFPATQGITHKLVEKLGYMYPPYFPYWFVDHWIDDIAKMIDRIAFADIHVDLGTKLPTQEMREPGFWATFFDSLRLDRRRQARDIIESHDFKEPAWRKTLLLRNYPLHEFRSQWINDQVRGFRMMQEPLQDERYERMKTAALQKMKEAYAVLEKELAVTPLPLVAA